MKGNGQTNEDETSSRAGISEQQNQKPFYASIEEYVDSAAENIMAWLTGAPARSVIYLTGPAGIGKTTLARKVYDSEMVRGHFDCWAWINVSRSYQIKDLINVAIKQIAQAGQHNAEGLDGMQIKTPIGTLWQSLESKRYMLVFDDVCRKEFWHAIKQGLPDHKNGSRIIITTASDIVVDGWKIGLFDYVYKLKPLSDVTSWELLRGIVFKNEPEQSYSAELEQLSREIIGMCKGFPLPVVSIAGLLSTKDKMSEWRKLFHNFRLDFKFNLHPPGALDVLALSFRDLPNQLGSCFLYFSIFPEDSLIPKDKLLKLWIAEGFVEEKRGKTLEEVAEGYLNELIHRNMVQACQGYFGLEQFFLVHRLIYNMARKKANELHFCRIWKEKNTSSRRKSLRLAIYDGYNAREAIEYSQLRSVFVFAGALDSSFLITLIATCELLTLLDLENVPIEHLPEELGNLFHLKYLSLKNTKVRKLPKSLDKLHNLETFDLRNTLLIELPIEIISKLKNLHHLLASVYDDRISGDSTRGVLIEKGIGCLEKLYTLMTVDVRLGGIGLVKELAKLRNLRRLGLSGLTAKFGAALCSTIDELTYLESLTLRTKNNNEILQLQTIFSMLPLLKCLVLKGPLQKLPCLIIGLQNLTTLCLSLSKLTDNLLIDLSPLPNLVSLWLYRAYEGQQLHFERGGFERLKLLVLRELHGLHVVEIEAGALPRLEELRIGSCPLLNEVPSGIEHLRNLKLLANYDMPSELVLSMQPGGGSDYWKVEHIPSVVFWYRVQGRSYKLYKLGDSNLLDHLRGLATNTKVIIQNQNEVEMSFSDSDDEDNDNIGQLSFTRTRSFSLRNNRKQSSFSSSFYTDDVEE